MLYVFGRPSRLFVLFLGFGDNKGMTRGWYVWEWSSCVGEGVLDAGVAARSLPFTIALASTGSFAIIAVDNTVNDFTKLIKHTHLRSCDRNSPSPCLQGWFPRVYTMQIQGCSVLFRIVMEWYAGDLSIKLVHPA